MRQGGPFNRSALPATAPGGLVEATIVGPQPKLAFQPFNPCAQLRLVFRGLLQAQLLPTDRIVPFVQLTLEAPQPRNIGPIGHADEMREHVHVAERLLHQLPVRRRVVLR